MRKNENKQERRNKGFTLVELIIVIAILAVIAAIAAPNLIGNIKKSRETANKANAKVIGEAALVYQGLTTKNRIEVKTVTGESLSVEQKFANSLMDHLQGTPQTPEKGSYYIALDKGKVQVYDVATDGTALYPGN